MRHDSLNQYRSALHDRPPRFVDYVDTPWEDVPDLPDFNRAAFQRVVRTLGAVSADPNRRARSVLVLGEAGSGKTHLLMRVARTLGRSNHILFVPKPNNEDAVAQHVWRNVVESLTRALPGVAGGRSQLDDMLAHVFTSVLVPELRADIAAGRSGAEQRRIWVRRLEENPYNLFDMLGRGERRQKNMSVLRNRTLRYFQANRPGVDQNVARALITYCFVSEEHRKRLLLTWLSGQDVSADDARSIGLPESWVPAIDGTSDRSQMQQREAQALKAIYTIGILSTFYHPLILAFDQLEGLRNDHVMTQRLGDVMREVITHTPNLLLIVCVFPGLWESWFSREFDASVVQRVAAERVNLEPFAHRHARAMLEAQMGATSRELGLPDPTYPFTDTDVARLCEVATTPRSFIQEARNAFNDWLDGADDVHPGGHPVDVDRTVVEAVEGFALRHRNLFERGIPNEQDLFGRVRQLFRAALAGRDPGPTFEGLTCGGRVMPQNFLVRCGESDPGVVVAVLNAEGNSFTSRLRNLLEALRVRGLTGRAVILRDARQRSPGPAGGELLQDFQNKGRGGGYVEMAADGWSRLNALYDAVVAVEQQDLTAGHRPLGMGELIDSLRRSGTLAGSPLFQEAARRSEPVAVAIRRGEAAAEGGAPAARAHPSGPGVPGRPHPGSPRPVVS